MKACPWTERIEAAALRGALDADERGHIGSCSDCRDVCRTIQALRADAADAERTAAERLPSAAVVVAAARPDRARALERDVLWPILWLERAAAGLGALAALAVAWWLVDRAQVGSAIRVILSAPQSAAPSIALDWQAASLLLLALTVLTATLYGLLGFDGTRGHRR